MAEEREVVLRFKTNALTVEHAVVEIVKGLADGTLVPKEAEVHSGAYMFRISVPRVLQDFKERRDPFGPFHEARIRENARNRCER